MESAHRGKRSIEFLQRPAIISFASVAGKKEAHGPLANTFDVVSEDTTFGEKSWEKAETRMQKTALPARSCRMRPLHFPRGVSSRVFPISLRSVPLLSPSKRVRPPVCASVRFDPAAERLKIPFSDT